MAGSSRRTTSSRRTEEDRAVEGPGAAAGFFARLGCTRIGSPGIFGERNTKALFTRVDGHVGHERKWVGHRASSRA